MQEAFTDLINNPAFWGSLSAMVVAFFGYKEVVRHNPDRKLRKNLRKASSFEELRAVVEVLQGELVKKDKRHKEDTDYLLLQLRQIREDNRQLSFKYAAALELSADQARQIEELRRQLNQHETRLNKETVDGKKSDTI